MGSGPRVRECTRVPSTQALSESAPESPSADDPFGDGSRDDVTVSSQLYEFEVHGRLGPGLGMVIEGLEVIRSDRQCTRMRRWIVDQSALRATLDRLAGLGLELTSMRRIESAPAS